MNEHAGRWFWILSCVFVLCCGLWMLSVFGVLPFSSERVSTPQQLIAFLDSPRDDMRPIDINGHRVEIGKRPALQVLPGYDEHLYLVRPYREVYKQTRSLTRAEMVDFLVNVRSDELEDLRVRAGEGTLAPVWTGRLDDKDLRIYRVSMYTYLLQGLSDHVLLISQVALAVRVGMPTQEILTTIVPEQRRWYGEWLERAARGDAPMTYLPARDDMLFIWLDSLL